MSDKNLEKQRTVEKLYRHLDSLEKSFELLENAKKGDFSLAETGLDMKHTPTFVKLTKDIRSDILGIKNMAESSKQEMRNYRLILNDQEPLSFVEQFHYDNLKRKIKAGEESPDALETMIQNRFTGNDSKPMGVSETLIRIESKLDKLFEKVEKLEARAKENGSL